MPSTGRIRRLRSPDRHPAIRLDSGIEQGDEVSHHYDPMLAKLIVHGLDRPECIARLRQALAHSAIAGVTTNLPLLRAVAAHPAFAAGEIDTGFLDRELDDVLWSVPTPPLPVLAVAAWRIARDLPRPAADADPWSPWATGDGWRPAGAGGIPVLLTDAAGRRHELRLEFRDEGARVHSGGHHVDASLEDLGEGRLRLDCQGIGGEALVTADNDRMYVGFGDHGWDFVVEPLHADDSTLGEEDTHPVAPMPGTIVALKVAVGDRVTAGQPLLIMEGMKMELTLTAPVAGVVERVLCAAGDSVDADAVLVDIRPDEAR
jgi:acetyl/propionyl-CoA carboxylase alpha subunit